MHDLEIQELQVQDVGPVNLTVQASEIVCISGASGSGKSLLLRAIVDVIPHEGDARLGEQLASKTSAHKWRAQVGLLPAESQWWYETIGEHFVTRDKELLTKLGFDEEAWNWHVARCSTGEKQRLALLRLLCHKPACLLLDEPTGSLDPNNTKQVEKIIKEYTAEYNIPVIWVSHSEEQISRICTQHYKLNKGKLVKQ